MAGITLSKARKERDRHYFGIDFGTSNSYCCLTADGYISATPVMFDGKTSISTSVLWELAPDGTERLLAFGDRAVEEWGLRSIDERKNCRISTMFKPDIGWSETARSDARAFWAALLDDMQCQGVIPPDARDNLSIIIGVPAMPTEGFESSLREIVEAMNLGAVRTTPEPVGALITHVATRQDLSPGDARRGLLVVDFGGGTCDIAFMSRLEVQAAWGDPQLGGRLFDDLFYQWFIELNPDARNPLESSRDEYFVHWIRCREMKERFSITMNRNRDSVFSHHVSVAQTYYGGLDRVTWPQFVERARAYSPSESLRTILHAHPRAFRNDRTGRYDLIQWFSNVVMDGLRTQSVPDQDIHYVILTGGSSAWPFVRDCIEQQLHIARERIFYSANPMTAIGEGIALLPVIQTIHSKARRAITAQRNEKIAEIVSRIGELAESFASDMATEIVALVVDDAMRRILTDFSREGGTLASLQTRIGEMLGERSRECESIIQSREQEVLAAVNDEIIDVLAEWFRRNGMRHWSGDRHYVQDLGVSSPGQSLFSLDDPLFDLVRNISHLMMMWGGGALLGGGGVALLSTGLPGLVVGAVVGVLFSFLGFKILEGPIQRTVSRLAVPAWMASVLYSDHRLDRMVEKLRIQLHREMLDNARSVFRIRIDALRPEIETMVDRVIEDLSALDHL
ncbi:Hsp70 family protein [bacterium]|nr:Hsp70 family protein [candidate division CSSED10-310 bacterium]